MDNSSLLVQRLTLFCNCELAKRININISVLHFIFMVNVCYNTTYIFIDSFIFQIRDDV